MRERSSFDRAALQKVTVKVNMWEMRQSRGGTSVVAGRENKCCLCCDEEHHCDIRSPSVQKRAITIIYLLSRLLLEMDGGVQVQSDSL